MEDRREREPPPQTVGDLLEQRRGQNRGAAALEEVVVRAGRVAQHSLPDPRQLQLDVAHRAGVARPGGGRVVVGNPIGDRAEAARVSKRADVRGLPGAKRVGGGHLGRTSRCASRGARARQRSPPARGPAMPHGRAPCGCGREAAGRGRGRARSPPAAPSASPRVPRRRLFDHHRVGDLGERSEHAIELGGADPDPAHVHRPVGAAVHPRGAALGDLDQVAVRPDVRVLGEVCGVEPLARRVVVEPQRPGRERRRADQLADARLVSPPIARTSRPKLGTAPRRGRRAGSGCRARSSRRCRCRRRSTGAESARRRRRTTRTDRRRRSRRCDMTARSDPRSSRRRGAIACPLAHTEVRGTGAEHGHPLLGRDPPQRLRLDHRPV